MPVHVSLGDNGLSTEYDKMNGERVQVQKDARMKEYTKLVLPADKANYDVDLFLEEFFSKDHSRAILAMKLPGLENGATLHAAVEKVPGLHIISYGGEHTRTLTIGWDIIAVLKAAASGSAEQSKKRQPQEDAGWQAIMEEHRALVAKHGSPKVGQQVRVHYPQGTFSVRSDDIAAQRPEGASDYVLRFRGTRFATFAFGVVHGIMRFGVDLASATSDEFDTEDDSESEGGSTSPFYASTPKISDKHPKKRSFNFPPASIPAPKRRKPSSSSNPLRLYFQWRGRDTVEGMILLDDDTNPTHTGYIDMSDERCVAFSGVGNFGFLGHKARFEGVMTGKWGGPMAVKWENFSREVYEWEMEKVREEGRRRS